MSLRYELSSQIIETCLEMNRSGLNQGTSGNVSVRYQDGMLITPSGIPYPKLTPSHIVFVDGTGKNPETDKIPSSEWRFHLDILKSRPDLHAVVHTHALNCTALSILNREIPPLHYMIVASGSSSIPCVPYATYGSSELSHHVVEGFKKSKAILMQHHGMIAAEVRLDKALWLAHEVEVLASLYLKLLPMGEVPVLSDKDIRAAMAKFSTYGLK